MHVRLHEVGTRPLVHIPQSRRLELAVEIIRVLFPIGIHIGRALQEIPHAPVDELVSQGIDGEPITIGPILMKEWNGRIPWDAQIVGREVGEQRRNARGVFRVDRVRLLLLGSIRCPVQVTRIAHASSAEEIPARQFIRAEYLLIRVRERTVEFR